MSAVRAYNSDFPGRPDLKALALDIARMYDGNWEAMVEYKVMAFKLYDAEQLTAPAARQIINMALSDVNQQKWWSVIEEALDRDFESTVRRSRSPKLKIVKDEPENRVIDLHTKAKIKQQFGKPNCIQGIIHIIDPERTTVIWAARRLQHAPWWDFSSRTPHLSVSWKCQKYSTSGNVLLYDDENELPTGVRRCRKCQEA